MAKAKEKEFLPEGYDEFSQELDSDNKETDEKQKKKRIQSPKEIIKKIADRVRRSNPGITKFGFLGDEGIQIHQEVFSTSSLALDYKIKYGGIPRSRITHIYGPERSLKTTVALLAALDALKKYPSGFIVFVDFERNYDTTESKYHLLYLGFTEEMLNERIMYIRDTPEECFNAVEDLVQYQECLAVIVDSVGGMISGHAFDKKFEENAKMGQQPVLIGTILKRLNQKNLNSALIFINQARDVIGGYGHGPAYGYSGGRTLRHLVHLSLDLNGWHQKEDKDKKSANSKILLKARIDKCKVGGENSQTELEFDLGSGSFNRPRDCVILGYQMGILSHNGGWYKMYDGIRGGSGHIVYQKQGGDVFENEIRKTPELWQQIEKLVLEDIHAIKRIDWQLEESQYVDEEEEDEEDSEDTEVEEEQNVSSEPS